MTRQAKPPPPPERGAPSAPPAPPAWRHYLWLVAIGLFVLPYLLLPTMPRGAGPVSLS